MIPKIIHYCWFGKGDKSIQIQRCIDSWKECLKDYQIIEWNEDNFDINCNAYVKEAYESKKYAFVSDYVRLYVLYNYGGLYFDTDVQVIKNMDNLLYLDLFLGFEDDLWINVAIAGSKKGNEDIKLFLDSYNDTSFIVNDRYNLTTIPRRITTLLKDKYDINLNGETQEIINKNTKIFSSEFFYPIRFGTWQTNITINTYCIHYFNGSWL